MRARSTQFAEKIQRDQTRDQQRPRSDDGTFRDVAAPSRLLKKTCQRGPDESAANRLKSPRVYAGVERNGWPETRSRPVIIGADGRDSRTYLSRLRALEGENWQGLAGVEK